MPPKDTPHDLPSKSWFGAGELSYLRSQARYLAWNGSRIGHSTSAAAHGAGVLRIDSEMFCNQNPAIFAIIIPCKVTC